MIKTTNPTSTFRVFPAWARHGSRALKPVRAGAHRATPLLPCLQGTGAYLEAKRELGLIEHSERSAKLRPRHFVRPEQYRYPDHRPYQPQLAGTPAIIN
ncbi:hypothetical protein WG915_04885 [Corynebacterium sp. H128]|uniref:hypothetical protein n=1 Tax=Corynebacterium sp. H128 TaxID=3133427 RepID=UPI00309C1883